MLKIHLDIFVTGRVQGVGFRYSCSQKAKNLNLTGWVRNEPDGGVSLAVEGQNSDLEKFVEWCKTIPSPIKIKDFKVKTGPVRNFPFFEAY